MRPFFPRIMLVTGAILLTGALQTNAAAIPGEPNDRFTIFSWSPQTPNVGETVTVTGRYCEPNATDGPWTISLLEIYNPVGEKWQSTGTVTEQNADGSWKGTIKIVNEDPNGPGTIDEDDMRIHAACTTDTTNEYHPLDSYFPIGIGRDETTTTTAAPVPTTAAPVPTTAPPVPTTAAPAPVTAAAATTTTAMNQLPYTGSATAPLTIAALTMIAVGAVAIGYRRRPSLR